MLEFMSATKKKTEATKIVSTIESLIEKKFEGYKNLSYNTNTKGYDYEFTVFKILKEYLGSRFIFLRPHIIDKELNYIDILSTKGGNEVDIAAIFKSTIPKEILRTEKTSFVFYDSVAFIIEVKSVLNHQSLMKDLSKMEKITQLPLDTERFPVMVGSQFVVQDRPLRILVYEKKSIQEKILNSILNGNNFWDLIFVVKDKITIVNKLNIPFAKFFAENIKREPTTNKVAYWHDVPFIALLLMIVLSVPDPPTVNVIKSLIKLVSFAYH